MYAIFYLNKYYVNPFVLDEYDIYDILMSENIVTWIF